MFGPPGVGKTYTAEAGNSPYARTQPCTFWKEPNILPGTTVAERARAPLYQMSAGMLGTNAEDVERALGHALQLCQQWNAMLLIDEADVFLGARTNNELSRNELVSSRFPFPFLSRQPLTRCISFPHQARILPRYLLLNHESRRRLGSRLQVARRSLPPLQGT